MRKELTRKTQEIEEEIRQVQRDYREKYKDTVGVFEGAGYTAKGLYRSGIEVGFVRGTEYNAVSRRAIERVIDRFIDHLLRPRGPSER